MIEFPKALIIQDKTTPIGFWGKSQIPIYYVHNIHALNQLVGYVKHINAENGTILYRGQCELYENMIPSICHIPEEYNKNENLLNEAIGQILADKSFRNFFHFNGKQMTQRELYEKLVVEATLQHYGAKTHCIDFVDNHWTALWFGAYRWDAQKRTYSRRANVEPDYGKQFIRFDPKYLRKTLPPEPKPETIELTETHKMKLLEIAQKGAKSYDELFRSAQQKKYKSAYRQWESTCKKFNADNCAYDLKEAAAHMYLFLFMAETNEKCINGLYLGENTYTIDLRKALPSTFLRPGSQHGWIVRSKKDGFDFNSNVACIIRIDIRLANEMLGSGTLLSQDNFFPNVDVDEGYHVLLERQIGSTLESKYPKIIPADFIKTY